MKPTVTAVRAIGVEFLRRTLRPFIIVIAVVLVVLSAAGMWAVTHNAWWLLLEVPLLAATIVFAGLTIALRLVLRAVDPSQTAAQKHSVSSFVDKMQRTAENVKTPQPLILYRVVRDVVRPRQGQQSFIASLAHDSKSLAPDFMALQCSFDDQRP